MDATRFDRLTRSLGAAATRRTALAGLLTGLVLPFLPDPEAVAERRRRKAKSDRQKSRRDSRSRRVARTEALPSRCCAAGICTPGPGKNLARCCYEGQDLAGRNFRGANLGQAVFSGATLTNANLSSANLDRACLVDADLTGARLAGANTGTAVFCRTTMPDGSVNDGGCDKGTPCCPTCVSDDQCADDEVCCGGRCVAGECCADADCPATAPICTSARQCVPCRDDAECAAAGAGTVCCSGACFEDECPDACAGTVVACGNPDFSCFLHRDAAGNSVCGSRIPCFAACTPGEECDYNATTKGVCIPCVGTTCPTGSTCFLPCPA